MNRHLRSATLLLLLFFCALAPGGAHASGDFLEPEDAFAFSVDRSAASEGRIGLHWQIAPGYYLYRDHIKVVATGSGSTATMQLPSGTPKDDPNFGVMAVYHDALHVPVRLQGAREFDVTWQGCAEAGLCYPPQTQRVTLAAEPSGTGKPGVLASLRRSAGASDSHIQRMLGEYALAWTIPLFFVLGLALAFTPCVLPMVPILSGIVLGGQPSPRRAALLSAAFVLPMALTYAAMGAGAALAGTNLQAVLQNRWVLMGFGLVFIVLALAMFGLLTLQLPAVLRDRLAAASTAHKGGTLAGAGMLGLLSALLVGPCMTAPLAGTLLYIAHTGNVVSGALLLFALGLGMGTPLLVICTLGARFLPKPGAWMDGVKTVLGFALLGTAVWMVQSVFAPSFVMALWGAWLMGAAVAAAHASAKASTALRLLGRSGALIAGLWAAALILGAAAGGDDPRRPLAMVSSSAASGASQARPEALPFETVDNLQALQTRLATASAAGQPVLLDFTADWCVSCRTIEHEVLADPVVREALTKVVRLRADVTASDAPQRALMRAHQVLGPPTFMLFDPSGSERREDRLVGEFGANELLQRLARLASPQGTRP